MKTEVKELGKNVVEVDITIDAKSATAEYDKACKQLAQRVNIDGFRKGKAPKAIVEKHVGVDMIQRQALEAMLPKVFADVVTKNNYDLVAEPAVMDYSFEAGKDATVKVKFELKPEVTIKAYKGLELEVAEYQNEDGAMEKELERVANKYASLEKVEGRNTTATDFVMFDFDGTCNGEAIKGGSAKNYMLDLGNSNFIPGFAEQLVDKAVDSEFTINVTFPAEYHDEKLKGQDAEFKIKINEIKEKKVPAIDDELAKKVGPFEKLDDLKADIQKYLDTTLENENKKRAYEAIFAKVIENTEVEIHESMIDREIDAMLHDMDARLRQQGGDLNAIIAKEGLENIRKEMAGDALSRIKNSLVISKIAQDEKIEVKKEDLENKLAEVAAMYQISNEQMMGELFKNTALLQSLSQQVVSEKVTQFLLDNNSVKYTK